MAKRDTVKQTKEQIKALNELRKSQGGLNLEQSKTLDNLRQMLSELTGLEKRQKKLVDQGGTYTDLSKMWADNAMDQKKGAQELAGIQKSQLSLLAQAAKGDLHGPGPRRDLRGEGGRGGAPVEAQECPVAAGPRR